MCWSVSSIDHAIDADAQAAGGRHAVLQADEKVLVERLGLGVASLASAHLLQEALALDARVVQLRKRVGDLDAASESLEAFDLVGIVGLALGQR